MRIDPRRGQSDLYDRSLLIARTPSTNRHRSAASTGCDASHSSLSISHLASRATRSSPPILKRTRHFYRVRFVFSSARTKTSCWISNIARTLNFCAANHPQQPRRLYCCLHHKQCKYALQEEQNRSLTMRLIHQFSFLRAIHGYVPVRSLSALYFRS